MSFLSCQKMTYFLINSVIVGIADFSKKKKDFHVGAENRLSEKGFLLFDLLQWLFYHLVKIMGPRFGVWAFNHAEPSVNFVGLWVDFSLFVFLRPKFCYVLIDSGLGPHGFWAFDSCSQSLDVGLLPFCFFSVGLGAQEFWPKQCPLKSESFKTFLFL